GWGCAGKSKSPKPLCVCSLSCDEAAADSFQSGEKVTTEVSSSSPGLTTLVNSERTAGSVPSSRDRFSPTTFKSESEVNGLCKIPKTFSDLACAPSKSVPNPDMKRTGMWAVDSSSLKRLLSSSPGKSGSK